jgi:hypothetical protein
MSAEARALRHHTHQEHIVRCPRDKSHQSTMSAHQASAVERRVLRCLSLPAYNAYEHALPLCVRAMVLMKQKPMTERAVDAIDSGVTRVEERLAPKEGQHQVGGFSLSTLQAAACYSTCASILRASS